MGHPREFGIDAKDLGWATRHPTPTQYAPVTGYGARAAEHARVSVLLRHHPAEGDALQLVYVGRAEGGHGDHLVDRKDGGVYLLTRVARNST